MDRQGAPWQPHWSFIKPERPALPEVEERQLRITNPIDRFVLAKLEAEGLDTRAGGRTAARCSRRLSLDLTGLPPSPEDVEAFVGMRHSPLRIRLRFEDSRRRTSRWVDKLMQSERWGEHRARYWLDAARYADTHGMHFDNYREMWPYRDWVISAFNTNQPFDQFTVEQTRGRPAAEPDRSTSSSPPASSAATSRPTKAARSTRRISRNYATRPRADDGLGLPGPDRRIARSATITSSTRSRSAIFIRWPRSSATRRSPRRTAT